MEQIVIGRKEYSLTSIEDLKVTEQDDRFTFKIDVYYEHFGEEPIGEQILGSTILENTGVEPFIRKVKIGEQPKELFLGDLERSQVGYVLITNLEGTNYQRNPSYSERDEVKKRIVLVNEEFVLYPFGMPFLAQPRPDGDKPIILRCLHGEARLQVRIFPR